MKNIILISIMMFAIKASAITVQSDTVFTYVRVSSETNIDVKRVYMLGYSVIGIAEVKIEYRISGEELITDTIYNYPQLDYGNVLFNFANDSTWNYTPMTKEEERIYLYSKLAERLNLNIID